MYQSRRDVLVDGLNKAGWRIEITATPTPLPPLPAAVEVAVYRIALEAVTNVYRHAKAKSCAVTIAAQPHSLQLCIVDDGPGFPATLQRGVGLNSMQERAEELGGRFTFENQAAGGARVQVWLPLPGEEQ